MVICTTGMNRWNSSTTWSVRRQSCSRLAWSKAPITSSWRRSMPCRSLSVSKLPCCFSSPCHMLVGQLLNVQAACKLFLRCVSTQTILCAVALTISCLNQSHHVDTGQVSPSMDLIVPGSWQGHIKHYMQTFQLNSFISALLMGTVDFCHIYAIFSGLGHWEGQKVSWKQNLLASFSSPILLIRVKWSWSI